MAAKFFTGLPLDGPDPECVQGYGEPALAAERTSRRPAVDHSAHRTGPIRDVLAHPLRPDVAAQAAPPGSATKVRYRPMARDTWFETVAIAQQRAKKRLPKSVYAR